MKYSPSIKRTAFPARGKSSSRQLNDQNDQVATDINALALQAAQNESDIAASTKTVLDEVRFLARKVLQLEQDLAHKKEIDGRNGLRVTFHQSMYKVDNLSFLTTTNSLRPVITPKFGVVHLPVNAVESKFFSNAIYNGDVITPGSLATTVTATFVPEGASTAVDHEDGALKVVAGTPRNAFNGNNRSYWIREVQFPASSDVTEVSVELQVTLPSQNNTNSNVLTIHPYPIGSVDITDISTSPDLTQSFVKLQHKDAPSLTSPMNNAGEKKFIFPAQDIDQVRVRLRCRNFVEEDGKKIFRYGLQDVGLSLVDFEKSTAALTFTNWSAQADEDNVSMMHKIDAPTGFFFTAIHHFTSSPDIQLENDLNRHVIFRIYDADPSTGGGQEIWNSNSTYPQNQVESVGSQITLGGSSRSLYVVTNMRHVETSGGVNSPFPANTSPYINGFSLEASLNPAF